MTKIIIYGNAGQGVKLVSIILANILQNQGYQIALSHRYSPLVRSGESNAYLIFSKDKIENPLVEDADFEYDLNKTDLQVKLLKKFDSPRMMNMVLLGVVLNDLKIKVISEDIKKFLPKKLVEENLSAIMNGYKS
ncbi:2-oxoacid:acceptor oxidoreductase family protein [Candidatus Woesearchaeota archaeon]|nr:2-oxoacid:acceptor oxidoreductase family protein [Candidatus Woesearchaeota archaeon]